MPLPVAEYAMLQQKYALTASIFRFNQRHLVDIALFLLVIACPLGMTVLLITGHLEPWFYLFIHGAILWWGLEILKKLDK